MDKKWEERENKLFADFEFAGFKEAMKFVKNVGEIAEKQDHHPDICLHDYKYVSVKSTTHSEGKLTQKDYTLADNISKLLS